MARPALTLIHGGADCAAPPDPGPLGRRELRSVLKLFGVELSARLAEGASFEDALEEALELALEDLPPEHAGKVAEVLRSQGPGRADLPALEKYGLG